MKKVICLACGGNRGSTALVKIADQGCTTRWMDCSLCGGLGYVSEQKMDWLHEGHRLRYERITKNRSLREEADRLGLSAVEYSKMERGIELPYTLRRRSMREGE